jgi:hypothetical protein
MYWHTVLWIIALFLEVMEAMKGCCVSSSVPLAKLMTQLTRPSLPPSPPAGGKRQTDEENRG